MFFLICGTMVDNWNIEKLTALFPRKIHFSPNLGIKDSKWPQNRVFWIFWKILLLVFLWNNLKWKLILLPKIRSLHISAISPEKRGYEVDFLHADEHKNFYNLTLSLWVWVARHAQRTHYNKITVSSNISRKTWRMKLVFCLQINILKVYSNWHNHFRFISPDMPKLSK